MVSLEGIQALRESFRQLSCDPQVLALRVGEGRRVVCLSLVSYYVVAEKEREEVTYRDNPSP